MVNGQVHSDYYPVNYVKLDLAKDGDDSEEDGVGIANATEDEELNTTVMCV